MNESTEIPPNPSNVGKFRIAHLSDVHFGANFDLPLWDYVEQLLRKDPPDLILITGDVVDSPGLVSLILARRQLESLANKFTKSRKKSFFRIIPGNHDIAILGNVKIWPMSYFFDWVFYDISSNEIEDFPTYVEYVKSSILERTATYLKICRFAFRRICKTAKFFFRQLPRPVTRQDDPREVLIAYLDSNIGLRLATGRVSEFQVAAVKAAVMDLTLNEQSEIRSLVPRIALLHHHAMPIPYSDGNEGLTSFEPFLMLRNAGTLLRELCRQDFDLVLHGHRHYSNYCRITFSKPDDSDGELTVIAAGSCGVGLPEEGRNSINLIDISRNGQIMVEKCLFGNGESPDTSNRGANLRQRLIFDIPSLKRRSYRRALEVQGREADLLYREVRIDETGSSSGVIYFDNFRLVGKSIVKHRVIRLETDIGSLIPEFAYADEASIKAGLSFKTFHPEKDYDVNPVSNQGGQPELIQRDINDKVLVCQFDIEHVTTSSARGIHYGIEYSSDNSFQISAWEGRLIRDDSYLVGADESSPSTEAISITIKYPCRKLMMKIKLPGNLIVQNAWLQVQRPKCYPLMKLVDGDIDYGSDELEIDPDITSFESGNFRKQEMKANECYKYEYELEVEYPLVGYVYRIAWNVLNQEETTANPLNIGRAEAIRKKLLDNSGRVHITRVTQVIEAVQGQVQENFGSKYSHSETITVCLHVLDTEEKELKLIAAAPNTVELRSHCTTIPWARGVRGTAAKKRRLTFYITPRLRSGRYKGTKLHSPPERTIETYPQDYTILLAYPIMLARKRLSSVDRPPPQELIGVLSFGSDASDSGLLRVVYGENNDETSDILKMSHEHEKLRTWVTFIENTLSLVEPDKNTKKL